MSPRQQITRVGTVLSTSFLSPSDVPSFRICLETAGGFINVRWLGRTEVPGVTLGRRLQVCGIPLQGEDGVELINPDYHLLGVE